MTFFKKSIFLILLSLGAALAHAGDQAKLTTPDAPALSLMFFLNPNGAPCQAQEKILNQFRARIEQRARIVPVSTQSFSAQMLFRKFGIRYLPALVLVDANQQEVMRFAPGIQPGEQILKELAGIKVANAK